jgi:outer membrane translocation and assembly module TamA
MKKTLTFLVLIAALHSVSAQSIIPKFIRKMYLEKDTSKKSSFVLLPVLSSAPETGIEVGGAGLLSFYTDTVGHITRVSNVFAYATLTTKGQNRLSLSSTYWTPQNKIHYTAAIGYINFPSDFYGIGNNTHKADADLVDEKRLKVNFETDYLLARNFYIGYVAGGFNYKEGDKNLTGIFNTSTNVEDRTGGASVFIGPSINFDTRNNNTYTTKGMVITAYYNMMQGILSNNSYQGGFFNLEYSQFFALNKRLVLGLDVQEQSLTGNRSPFYLLPALGSDEMMRGYYNGRYRDRNFIAGQAELRYRMNDRIGVVGFIGAGEVFHSSFSVPQLKPDLGGGLRYFFDVEKGLSVRLDYGVGQKPAGEKRESGFYIGLGQAF